MLKRVLLLSSLMLFLVSLASCGGGGGGVATDSPAAPAGVVTKETLKISLVGNLPANSSMSGVSFTLFFPSCLTPQLENGVVAANVVTPSGTFAAAVQLDPSYTPPATSAAMGKVLVTLVDVSHDGVSAVGEVATISLQLAEGATPTTTKFILGTDGVFDLSGKPIATLTAVLSGVVLQ